VASVPSVDVETSSNQVDPEVSASRWWPTGAFVIGAAFAVAGFWIGLGRLSDNSFFTHLATGRLILDHGIPRTDPYSFTANGEPWVVQSWLASVVFAWTDSWFGAQGLRVLAGALTAGLAAMTWRLTRPAHTIVGRILIAAAVVGIGGSTWAPRPLLFGLLCVTLTLLAAEKGLDPRWLVPVFWLWVNCHGSFPLGLVLLGCLWVGRRADGDSGTLEWRCLKWAALGTALGAVNPLGPALLTFPIRLLGRFDVLRQVVEWQSPSFSLGWTRLFLLEVAVAVVVLVRRPSYRSALPLVVFVIAALLGARNIAVASLILVPGLARGLADIGSVRATKRSPAAGIALAGIVLAAAVIAQSALSQPAYDLATYPVEAVAWINANHLRQSGTHLVTSDSNGNYLELLSGIHADVFIDDRVDMFPKSVVADLVTLIHGGLDWRDVLDRNGSDLVVWGRAKPLTALMAESPDWRILYQDADWSIGCRRGAELGGTGNLSRC